MKIRVKGSLGEIEVDISIPQGQDIDYTSIGRDTYLKRWEEMQTKIFAEIRNTYKHLIEEQKEDLK